MRAYSDFSESIIEPVNLTKLLAKLSFVDEEVGTAAREQPQLYVTAARLRVQKLRAKEQAEAKLKLLRSTKASKIRSKITSTGERATEGRVSELLTADKEIRVAELKLRRSEEEEEYAKLVLEAYRMRRDSLKIIVELLGAEVYVQRAMSGDSTEIRRVHDELNRKYPKDIKKKKSLRRAS